MPKFFLAFILFLFVQTFSAQELNCLITVNADKISGSNKQVFTTLQQSLNEFVNQTQWTGLNVKSQEKINCAFTITINAQPSTNRFEASIQVQSARPVYGSSYSSPVLNINDNDFNFNYTEFEAFNYNTVSFESNLRSTIVFYIYVILGMDADTFALNGGEEYFKKAKDVAMLAQQNGGPGWLDETGLQNRFLLIDNLTNAKLSAFKNILYSYHRLGMDIFHQDKNKAKSTIESTILQLEPLDNLSFGNSILRLFFDAKSDEIVNLFSDGQRSSKVNQMKEVLQKISPTNTTKWQKIK
ncbi:DUF4835 domain-containing protein [Polaribacter pacificus]|uniref:DUF4835 domain-containing protein n=1 Tax=Polaribacter pacificus TaxID=1775173 RepID=A0A917I0Q7_9FLAO|nr:DUF4835 family protein [Polaribacter pacificus]GGH00265.1 DUF4835 domain-containing protein [Polaribacter pacificus]